MGGMPNNISAYMTLTQASDQTLGQRQGPGLETVLDSKTPIRPVRMPGETTTGSPTSEYPPREFPAPTPSRVLFDIPDRSAPPQEPLNADKLRVLVAEDDPINSKIVQKRLEKIGHEVHLTINGEECSSTYGDRPAFFDVVLMDMQVSSCLMLLSYELS